MPSPSDSNPILLAERAAAEALGLTPRTLQKWRAQGIGPRFVRISSRCVRYRREDLEQFAADRVRSSTSEQAAPAA